MNENGIEKIIIDEYEGKMKPAFSIRPVTSQLTAIESGIDKLLQSHAALEKQNETLSARVMREGMESDARIGDMYRGLHTAIQKLIEQHKQDLSFQAGLAQRLEAIERKLEIVEEQTIAHKLGMCGVRIAKHGSDGWLYCNLAPHMGDAHSYVTEFSPVQLQLPRKRQPRKRK